MSEKDIGEPVGKRQTSPVARDKQSGEVSGPLGSEMFVKLLAFFVTVFLGLFPTLLLLSALEWQLDTSLLFGAASAIRDIIVGVFYVAGFGVLLIIAGVVSSSFRVIPSYLHLATLILGKEEKIRGPGLAFTIPFIEDVYDLVEMWQFEVEVPANRTLTKDRIEINAHANLLYRRSRENPGKSVYEVEDFHGAVRIIADNKLRAVMSKFELDELQVADDVSQILAKETSESFKDIGGEVVQFEFSDFEFVDEDVGEEYAAAKLAERVAEAKVAHAKADKEAFQLYKEAVLSVDPDADKATVLEVVRERMGQETARQMAQGGRGVVPFLDVGELGGIGRRMQGRKEE